MDGAVGQILIVDDTPENIKIIAEILKQDGYGISFANSGQKALDIIRLTPPDLVLLDIVMPGMDGFETCRKIKADPDTALLPVIFLSNITDSIKVVEGLKIGAVDYLNKPVQKDILLARVKTHLTIRSFQKDLEVKVDERTQDLSNALQQIDDIIMSMPSVVISLDEKGLVKHWNPAAELRTGISRSKAVGNSFNSLFRHPVITTARINVVRETGKAFRKRRVAVQGDELGYEDVTIYALSNNQGVVIYIEDVAEKVRFEEMMIQSEKMMSLGGLAAGIAHELNNPLAGMTQTAEFLEKILLEDLDPGNGNAVKNRWNTRDIQRFMQANKIPRLLSNIRKSGHRAAQIVNNMLSFSRVSDSRLVNCRIERILDETLDLASCTHHPVKEYNIGSIKIIKNYDEKLPKVPCDPVMLQQVFLNIVQNGIYSINTNGNKQEDVVGPILKISAALTSDKENIEIVIADNGPGIPMDLQKKIFDPFFTTKPTGVGTGLGLSISYFIVTRTHNGILEVKSDPGKNTQFIIKLPVIEKEKSETM